MRTLYAPLPPPPQPVRFRKALLTVCASLVATGGFYLQSQAVIPGRAADRLLFALVVGFPSLVAMWGVTGLGVRRVYDYWRDNAEIVTKHRAAKVALLLLLLSPGLWFMAYTGWVAGTMVLA